MRLQHVFFRYLKLVYYIHDINKDTSELLSNALLALTTLITSENVARVYSAQLFPLALVVYIGIFSFNTYFSDFDE